MRHNCTCFNVQPQKAKKAHEDALKLHYEHHEIPPLVYIPILCICKATCKEMVAVFCKRCLLEIENTIEASGQHTNVWAQVRQLLGLTLGHSLGTKCLPKDVFESRDDQRDSSNSSDMLLPLLRAQSLLLLLLLAFGFGKSCVFLDLRCHANKTSLRNTAQRRVICGLVLFSTSMIFCCKW